MRNVVAALDRIADRLEKAGLTKEAYKIDLVSDSLDAAKNPMEQTEVAPTGYLSKYKQEIPKKQPQVSYTGVSPKAGDIISDNRDAFDSQLKMIESAIKSIEGIFNNMNSKAVTAYPARTKNISDNNENNTKKLKVLLDNVIGTVKQELRNFLIVAGGKEEAERFSIDHLRLASKKVVDKSV